MKGRRPLRQHAGAALAGGRSPSPGPCRGAHLLRAQQVVPQRLARNERPPQELRTAWRSIPGLAAALAPALVHAVCLGAGGCLMRTAPCACPRCACSMPPGSCARPHAAQHKGACGATAGRLVAPGTVCSTGLGGAGAPADSGGLRRCMHDLAGVQAPEHTCSWQTSSSSTSSSHASSSGARATSSRWSSRDVAVYFLLNASSAARARA